MGKTEKTSLNAAADKLRDAGLIVIKIGSALLFDQAGGQPDRRWMEALAEDVAQLVAQGKRVVLVSSGSIAIGRQILALPAGRIRLEENRLLRLSDRFSWPGPDSSAGQTEYRGRTDFAGPGRY